ncbi:LRR receptor-like serine threonine-protein kinase [Seminavis robusta]|uniref:LRR receptor-like serine threonine-protein kinase n=1 Tax=Seminavis robusta TaxID=568900 RepID=A0A9N8E0Y8_9STRA|nr:LRR receptor-like serine threonine-protein kinase [Seminavis robusta]|eukprot:Sro540_g162920.1 LRR receptor-like serine threonine-protein kinase (967) ;mRNA; f:4098-7274
MSSTRDSSRRERSDAASMLTEEGDPLDASLEQVVMERSRGATEETAEPGKRSDDDIKREELQRRQEAAMSTRQAAVMTAPSSSSLSDQDRKPSPKEREVGKSAMVGSIRSSGTGRKISEDAANQQGKDDDDELHLMKVVAMRSSVNTTDDAGAGKTKVQKKGVPSTNTAAAATFSQADYVTEMIQVAVGSDTQRAQMDGEEPSTNNSTAAAAMEYDATGSPLKQSLLATGQRPGAYSGAPGVGYQAVAAVSYTGLGTGSSQMELEGSRGVNSEQPNISGRDIETANRAVPAAPTASAGVAHNPNDPLEAAVQSATGAGQEAKNESQKPNQKLMYAYVGVAFLAVLIIVIVLCATLIPGGDSEGQADMAAANPNDPPPSDISLDEHIRGLFPNSTLEAMESRFSPQAEAFRWLLKDPELTTTNTYSDDRILQRMALATFYFATGGRRWDGNSGWLNYSVHECDWYSDGNPPCDNDISTLVEEFSSNATSNFTNNYTFWDDDDYVMYPEDLSTEYLWRPTFDDRMLVEGDGTIKQLHLPFNNLIGTLPPELFWLSNLRSIQFDNNEIGGHLVGSYLALLTDLRVLRLYSNQLEGSIPSELATLTNLANINLAQNRDLEGIPDELWELSSLQVLALDVGSTVPFEAVAQFDQLSSLTLAELTGTLPTEVGLLTKLTLLNLQGGRLRGTIPTTLGKLSDMTWLFLDRNTFTGEIPTELGLLANLTILELSENRLNGIPSELGMLTNLYSLRLLDCRLAGPIPSEIGQMSRLSQLYLQENDLASSLPTELGTLSKIRTVYFYKNELTGSIPSELARASRLRSLHLDSNMLNGTLPSRFGRIRYLRGLNLDKNSISGSIPTQFGRLIYMRRLEMSQNELTGPIPTEFGRMSRLEKLLLNDNHLTGTIPLELAKRSSGFFSLFDSSDSTDTLEELYLNGNNFTGSIPELLCDVEEVRTDCTDHFCGCNCACKA